jgi:hypothetical protein
MKATIHIECTPAEARACFGWPDVHPMQAAMMEQLQERMLSEMDRFSPEALVNQWLTTLPQQIERMQDLFAQMMLGELGKGAVDLHGSGHLKHGEQVGRGPSKRHDRPRFAAGVLGPDPFQAFTLQGSASLADPPP